MVMLRSAAAATSASLAAWLLGGWALRLAGRGLLRVDEVVALVAAGGGAVVATWYALTAAVLVVAEIAVLSRRTVRLAAVLRAGVRRLGPPVLRRAAVVGVGAGLALGVTPASAALPASPPAGSLAASTTSTDVPPDGGSLEDAVPLDLRPGSTAFPDPEPPSTAPAAPPAGLAEPHDDPTRAAGAAPHRRAGGAREAGHPSDTLLPSLAASPAPWSLDGDRSRVPPWSAAAPPPTDGGMAPGPVTPRPDPSGPSDAPESGVGTAAPAGTSAPPPASGPASAAPVPPTSGQQPAPPSPGPADSGALYVVRPGDTLWGIAAAHLGADAADAEIAADWPRWHSTNRAVIGADPHLIRPGQELLAPDRKDAP